MTERGGWLSGATATMLVGASFPVTAALEGFPASAGQAIRYLAGALLLTAVARGRLVRPAARELAVLALVAAAGMAGFNLFVVAAVDAFGGANTGVVVGASPILLALLAGGAAGKSGRTLACAVAVAAGAALVTGTGGTFAAAGLALALGALAGEVLFTLLAAPLLPRLGPLSVATWAAYLATAELALVSLATAEAVPVPTVQEAAAIAYLAVLTTAVAFVCWFRAVERLGAGRAGLLVGLMPVAAVAVEMALERELAGVVELAGVGLVVAGVVAGQGRPRAGRAPARAAVEAA